MPRPRRTQHGKKIQPHEPPRLKLNVFLPLALAEGIIGIADENDLSISRVISESLADYYAGGFWKPLDRREKIETLVAAIDKLKIPARRADTQTDVIDIEDAPAGKGKPDGKPPHWTQTPEGRKRMAAAQKRAWKTRRANGKTEK